MSEQNIKTMLDAGVHFGHLTRKWNPNMAPYIFMERNGIHIIDLYKTEAKLSEASEALRKIAASGRKIMYVATKKQAKEIIAENAKEAKMPYITERWPGGMLTNFVTIRKAIKKMQGIDKMKEDGSFDTLSKRERLQVDRQRAKLDRELGSIADMTRIPGALFIVDINKEHIAVKEAKKLGIPTFAIVDTNSDPKEVDYAIPGNDDATKSISVLVAQVSESIKQGLTERAKEKNRAKDEKIKKTAQKKEGGTAPKEDKGKKADTAKKAPAAEATTEAKAGAKEEVKAEAKTEEKPQEKTQTNKAAKAKSEAKTQKATAAETTTEAKAGAKEEVKAEAKTEEKAQEETKAKEATEAKSEAKTQKASEKEAKEGTAENPAEKKEGGEKA